MIDFLNRMVRADLGGPPVPPPEDQHLKPIYFSDSTRLDPEDYYAELIDISRRVWLYRGYAGLLRPWHDEDSYKFLRIRKDNFREFFYTLEDADINWKSYCFLLFLMSNYELWDRPMLLVFQSGRLSWFRKLRAAAGSRAVLDELSAFVSTLIDLQVQAGRDLGLPLGGFTGPDPCAMKKSGPPPKYLAFYHHVLDRISALKGQGVDPSEWLKAKYARCLEFKKEPKSLIPASMLVNVNSLDPDVSSVKAMQRDPWRDLRQFLGLSFQCVFKDNCVPKGWRPSSEDMDDLSRVVCITADGYYYRSDGSQRRGKRHYAQNKYLNICCLPDNLEAFKFQWDDPRLLSATPTWEEYSKWGLYPGIWDESGTNVSKYTSLNSVKWRKK